MKCIAGACLLLAVACAARASRAMVEEQAAVQAVTLPVGGTISDFNPPTRDGWTVRSSWILTAPQPWADYLTWVTGHLLLRGYEVATDGGTARTFSKHLPGDVFIVRLERVSDRGVRVILIGAPD